MFLVKTSLLQQPTGESDLLLDYSDGNATRTQIISFKKGEIPAETSAVLIKAAEKLVDPHPSEN